MYALVLVALNGLALGLASTLHCAGMCGAISCSLLYARAPESGRNARAVFALTHAGRILAYALAGAAVGILGAPAIAWLDREVAFRLLQWAGATSLVWIGLSTAGVLPSLALLDRAFARVSGGIAHAGFLSSTSRLLPLIGGMAWGMMPCAMVYAALFTAMLTGSGAAGAATMLAFGIGTLPGLIGAALGFRQLAGIAGGGIRRIAAGFAIALLGVATVFVLHPAAAYLCIPGQPAVEIDQHQAQPRAAILRFDSKSAPRAVSMSKPPT
jgi:sulfite exporter TauE/SafE